LTYSIVFYIIENTEVTGEFITSKNPDAMSFFIIKPRHPGRLKKADLGGKPRSASPDGHVRKNGYP